MTAPAYTATSAQWASATSHLELRSEWQTVRIGGVRYVILTSGTSGRVYHVRADAAGCLCRWYGRTLQQCSHMLAVELAALEDELREDAQDRLNDEIDGAIELAFLALATSKRPGAGAAITRYEMLFGSDD